MVTNDVHLLGELQAGNFGKVRQLANEDGEGWYRRTAGRTHAKGRERRGETEVAGGQEIDEAESGRERGERRVM